MMKSWRKKIIAFVCFLSILGLNIIPVEAGYSQDNGYVGNYSWSGSLNVTSTSAFAVLGSSAASVRISGEVRYGVGATIAAMLYAPA